MVQRQTAPFGSWKSPIRSELIVRDSVGLGQLALDGEDIYWVEARPLEEGRHVLVKRTPDGQFHDQTPQPFSVRSRVHEYGGGAYVVADGTIYFSNFADQRLYRQGPGGSPEPIAELRKEISATPTEWWTTVETELSACGRTIPALLPSRPTPW